MPPFALNQPDYTGQFETRVEQHLVSESEPDPLFFVESWTIGVPAAVKNLQQRRQWQKDRERRSHSFDRFHSLRTLSFLEERGLDTEFLSTLGPAPIADNYVSGLPPQSPEMPAQSRLSQENDAFGENAESIQGTSSPVTLQDARNLDRKSVV